VPQAGGPIGVYGASGYTGKLILRELVRRGLPHVLAGRSAARLRAAAAQAGTDAPVRTASVEDRDALRHALGDCSVVINCAGPFSRWGEAVVRAAIETGAHYLDTTGEQLYMKRIADRWDGAARAAEVAVVCAAGFDYVPGDLIAHLAAQGHEPLRELVVAYSVGGVAPSRGTMQSMLEIVKSRALHYDEGAWRTGETGHRRAVFTFPDEIGRAPMMKYASGEVVTAPQHLRTRRVTALIDARSLIPHPALGPLLTLTLPVARLALRTPLRSLASMAIDRLPERSSLEDQRTDRFTIVAVAAGEDGSVGRGVVRGSDVYGLTAAIAVHGAALMAAQDFGGRSGVLAPAAAFEPRPFLDRLTEHGLSYEV